MQIDLNLYYIIPPGNVKKDAPKGVFLTNVTVYSAASFLPTTYPKVRQVPCEAPAMVTG